MNPQSILGAIARETGIDVERLKGPCQRKSSIRARNVAMALCRDLCGMSSIEVGELLNRHHSTVLHGSKKAHQGLMQRVRQTLQMSSAPGPSVP